MSSSISTGAAATHLAGLLSAREHGDDSRALSAIGLASGATEIALLGGYLATSGPAAKPLLKGESGGLLIGATVGLLLAAALEITSLRSRRHDPVMSAVAGAATLAAGAMLRWAIVRAGRASADDREGTLEAMKPRKGSPGWRS
jgi:formate-dependent nitrite reductase membrane component NrfD